MTSINTGGAGTRGQPISFFSVFVLIIICFLQKRTKKEKAHFPVAPMLSALHCIAVHSQAIKKKFFFSMYSAVVANSDSPCRNRHGYADSSLSVTAELSAGLRGSKTPLQSHPHLYPDQLTEVSKTGTGDHTA